MCNWCNHPWLWRKTSERLSFQPYDITLDSRQQQNKANKQVYIVLLECILLITTVSMFDPCLQFESTLLAHWITPGAQRCCPVFEEKCAPVQVSLTSKASFSAAGKWWKPLGCLLGLKQCSVGGVYLCRWRSCSSLMFCHIKIRRNNSLPTIILLPCFKITS